MWYILVIFSFFVCVINCIAITYMFSVLSRVSKIKIASANTSLFVTGQQCVK